MKLRPEVYLGAAKILDAGYPYACLAIDKVTAASGMNEAQRFAHRCSFERMFEPTLLPFTHLNQGWYGAPTTKRQEQRVLALLLAAEVARTGDLVDVTERGDVERPELERWGLV